MASFHHPAMLEHLSNLNVHVPESMQTMLERNPDALMAMMNGMTGGGNRPSPMPSMGGNAAMPSGNSNSIIAMLSQMFPGLGGPTPPPTTTTPKPPTHSFGHFGSPVQLPSHLSGLLSNGLSNAQGFKPQDLIALTSAGMGAGTNAAPRDITSLLSSMNPMAMLTPGGMGGHAGGRGRGPVDPEKMAEQREEMMMRAAMAGAMKSMMGASQQRPNNGTAPARNPMANMMTLMALQNGLGGGGGSGMEGGMGGMGSMLSMMGGGPFGGGMGMGPASLFSSPFAAGAK